MKLLILVLFASVAALAESQQPPVAHCNVIAMQNGVPVFVCIPEPTAPPQPPPVVLCNVIVMENGKPVFVCMPQPNEARLIKK